MFINYIIYLRAVYIIENLDDEIKMLWVYMYNFLYFIPEYQESSGPPHFGKLVWSTDNLLGQ